MRSPSASDAAVRMGRSVRTYRRGARGADANGASSCRIALPGACGGGSLVGLRRAGAEERRVSASSAHCAVFRGRPAASRSTPSATTRRRAIRRERDQQPSPTTRRSGNRHIDLKMLLVQRREQNSRCHEQQHGAEYAARRNIRRSASGGPDRPLVVARIVHTFAQVLAGLEVRHVLSRERDRLARLGIATLRGDGMQTEAAEPADLDTLSCASASLMISRTCLTANSTSLAEGGSASRR